MVRAGVLGPMYAEGHRGHGGWPEVAGAGGFYSLPTTCELVESGTWQKGNSGLGAVAPDLVLHQLAENGLWE